MTPEAVAIMTKIENEAKRLAAAQNFRWDNKHPTFREANEAFEAGDVDRLKQIWIDNFC